MKLTVQKSKRQVLADREIPASKHIAVSHLISPHIFQTKDGSLGAVIAVQGCAFELQDHTELNFNQKHIARFILLLAENFSVYFYTHRRRHNVYPPGEFPSGFAKDFDTAYQNKFKDKPLFVNDQYIVIVTKNSSTKLISRFDFLRRLTHKTVQQAANTYVDKQYTNLKKVIIQSLEYLQDFTPRLLGEKEQDQNRQSELLEFFSILVNGKRHSFNYPNQDIASILPLHRIFFGHDTLEWQGNTPSARKLGAVLSLRQYGAETTSTALDNMLKVDFEYLSTHSFSPMHGRDALEKIRKQRKHLFETNDASNTQQNELEQARDLLGSNLLSFGMHHHTLLILADTKEELNEHCAEVQKIYDNTGIKVIRESLNLEGAFWAQTPGNFSYIRRAAMITNENLADYCPLHNYHHGYINGNHLGSALMLVESTSRTPLYVNFHARGSGSKNDFTPGTTTITAPTGAGKTTLMLALDAQSQKYGGTRIFFDRGRGVEAYVRAMAGFYSCIHPSQPTGFNPLGLADTPDNRNFLTRWLGSLLVKHAEDQLNASEGKHVEAVINRSYTLPQMKRTLSVIASFFPTDFSRLDNLSPWLHSTDSNRPSGRLAYLFDNPVDTLDLNIGMAGFDMTHLLSSESAESVIFSVMLYLFKWIESMIDGQRLMGIYLDEGWQLLRNNYWVGKIEEYINTARKRNTYLVFSTQFPKTVAQSPLRGVLIEGASTHIFLPNNRAEEVDYIEAFKLSRREYEIIKETPPQERKFIIKQGHESALGKLNLRGLDDYIAILSGNDATVKLIHTICQEVGDNPAVWLPIFQERRPK